MAGPTRRDTLMWSGLGLGTLSTTVIAATILPQQGSDERRVMERRAAIHAFEIYEGDDNAPLADVESTEVGEQDGVTHVTGTVRNEQDDNEQLAVALRVEFGNDEVYGWTELLIDPGENDDYEVTAESVTPPDSAVDVVAVDWHI
jgi:hypothetical protein